MRKVHAVMQGKGSVGKTYIASLIAQYLIEQGEPVVCLDTDMVNATFRDLKALKVEPVDLFKPDKRWCTQRTEGEMIPVSVRSCGGRLVTNGVRASGCQHPVQDRHAHGGLRLLGSEATCS